MTEKINPATGKPHFRIEYSKENEDRLLELQNKVTTQSKTYSPEEVQIAATAPFAMMNMRERINKLDWEDREHRIEELSENLSEAAKNYENDLTFWFTELVQNAMDSGWDKENKTTLIELNISKDKVEFFHNGRPPHYRQKIFKHKLDGSELMSMVWKGSTKRANLGTEGRFGIGFKFWTYHFNTAKLEAENWGCEWDKDLENVVLGSSDVSEGMRLTFSNCMLESTKEKLNHFCTDPLLIVGEIDRLISGISMLNRSLQFSISVDGTEVWSIKHDVKKLKSNFLKISNIVSPEVASIKIPESSISYSSEGLGNLPEGLKNLLISSWKTEIIRRKNAISMKRILEKAGWNGNENNLEAFAKTAAIETLKDFNSSVLVDLDEKDENQKHFLLHSLFPIGNPGELESKGTKSRLNFQGQFSLMSSRTVLNRIDDGRNTAIVGILSNLYHRMLAELYDNKSREEIGISEKVYFDILNFKKSQGEEEFFDLLEDCINTLDKNTSRWPYQYLTDFESPSLSLIIPGAPYPSEGGKNTIPWIDSVPIRPEIRHMLESENPDVQNWASNFIHEKECYVNFDGNPKPVDSESYFVKSEELLRARTNNMPQHSHDQFAQKYQMKEQISILYQKKKEEIFSNWIPNTLPKPNVEISEQIANLLKSEFSFDDKWPYWLPIPVKEAGTRKHPAWMLPKDLKRSLVFKNKISFEDEDMLLDEIKQYAIDEGLMIYELAIEWEPLYAKLTEIREIPLIEGDTNLVLERCVQFLIDSAENKDLNAKSSDVEKTEVEIVNEKLREILERVGQDKEERWPFFMENTVGDLLMICEPDSQWNYVLMATNDVKNIEKSSIYKDPEIVDDPSVNKTLWWLTNEKKRADRGFVPLHSDATNDSPKIYIRNLSDKSKTYTHLIESNDGNSQFLEAYKDTVKSLTHDQSGERRENVVEFSPVRIAYEEKFKQITEFDCVVAKEITNTGKKALDFVKRSLPGLPSFINAKFIYFSNDFLLEPPGAKGHRSPTTFMSKPNHIHGFMRHIFRIPNVNKREGFSNNNDTDSLSREPTNLTYDWNNLSSIQRSRTHQRNYCLLVRTVTPEAAAFEVMENNANPTQREVKNALLLASHAHSPRHKSTANATRNSKSTDKKNHHLRIPFAFWVAYWTKTGTNSRSLNLTPLFMKPDPDFNELERHSNHEALSEFKKNPHLVAGITCPDNEISANGIIISRITKDKQNAVGTASTNWSECPYVGKLAEMLATMLSDSRKIPIDDFSLENLTVQKVTLIREQLKQIQIEFMEFESPLDSDESLVSKEWLLQSNIEQFDELLSEIIAKSVEENNPDLLHIVYSIHDQMKKNNLSRVYESPSGTDISQVEQEGKNNLQTRLSNWRGQHTNDDFVYVKDLQLTTFVKLMCEADVEVSSADLNLARRLRNAGTKSQALKAMRDCTINRFYEIGEHSGTPYWRLVQKRMNSNKQLENSGVKLLTANVSKLVKLEAYLTQSNSQRIPQWGYGLKEKKPTLQLTRQEAEGFETKKHFLSQIEYLEEHNFFEKSYQNLMEIFRQKESSTAAVEHLGFRTSTNWQFLANSMSVIAATWYRNKHQEAHSNELLDFLGKLGDLEISIDKGWTDEIHGESSITYGNGGWSVSDLGVFCTAIDHLGKKGMEMKIDVLDKLLNYCMNKICGTSIADNLYCDNRNFLDIFNIEDPSSVIILQGGDSPKAKDTAEKVRWLEENTTSLSDNVFEGLLKNEEKWSSWTNCRNLFVRNIGDISAPVIERSMAKWFSVEHTKNYDSRDILLRLYPGLACTVVMPGTFTYPLEDNDEMGLREMIRLQGHDGGEGNLLLDKQGVSKEKYQGILKHFGNRLIVSTQMAAQGKVSKGWKIKTPPSSNNKNLFDWLTRNGHEKLQELWKPDIPYIKIPEVVYPRNYDPKGDLPNDLIVHKLHLVYMIVFNKLLAEALSKDRS